MPLSYRAAQNLIKRGDEAGLRAALDDHLDPNLVNENGWTLLMLAAVEGSIPLTELLCAHGADASRLNAKGQMAHGIATSRGFIAVAEVLNRKLVTDSSS